MRQSRIILALVVLALLMATPAASFAGPPDSATVMFGRPTLGSGCVFPCLDDASFHAVDAIQPGAVAISDGGSVTFDVQGFHQVAIYGPGITPKDIQPDPAAFPFVADPNGRLLLAPPLTDVTFTFNEPGTYLVICNVAPHFEDAQMWAWVQVK